MSRAPSTNNSPSDSPPDSASDSRLAREVIDLAWPAILQGLVTTIVLFTDRLFLGHYATEAIGSMAISGPVMWSAFSVFAAYNAGIVAVVGRAVGRGDGRRTRSTVRSVLVFAFVIGIAVAILGWSLRHPLTQLLAGGADTSNTVRQWAADYMEIVFLAAPLSFVGTAMTVSMQAGGDTRTPMWIGAMAGLLNLLATWLLVYGVGGLPEMGVQGAAIGTALAMGTYAVGSVWVLWRRDGLVSLRSWGSGNASRGHRDGLSGTHAINSPPSPEAPLESEQTAPLKSVLRVARAAFAEKVIYHAGYIGFVALIGYLGDAAMAAHQALIAIESISFIAADGLGVAAGALVAMKLGKERSDQAERAGWLAAKMGAVLLAAVGLIFLLIPELCIQIFTDDPEVIAIGARCLRVAAIAQPLMAVTDALAGALRGAGDTATPMKAAILGTVVVRLGACWLLAYPLGLGLLGIWIGSTLDWAVRAVWLSLVFRKGRWKDMEL